MLRKPETQSVSFCIELAGFHKINVLFGISDFEMYCGYRVNERFAMPTNNRGNRENACMQPPHTGGKPSLLLA